MEFKLNNIYNVDSYKAVKDIPDNSIDLVIIDPPYDIPHTTGGGMLEEKGIRNMFDNLVENDITNAFDFEILKELDRIMKKRNIYIWCNKLLIPKLFEYYKGSLFDIISWHKTNAMPLCGSKYLTDTEYCLYFHDTMKLNTTYDTAKTHYEQGINVRDKSKDNDNICYSSLLVSDVINGIYPLEMPYFPADRSYVVLVEEANCYKHLISVTTPECEVVPINRYFDDKGEEISEEEFVNYKNTLE